MLEPRLDTPPHFDDISGRPLMLTVLVSVIMAAPQVIQQTKAMMQAVLLKGHGGFEQLEFRDDVPIPEPAPGEVLIRVGAAGVNNTDINTRTGWYSHAVAGPADSGWTGAPPQFPRIQGADA
jgi:hypothetical protein